MAQNIESDLKDEKWIGDICCLWTNKGWLNLGRPMDKITRKIMFFLY